MNNEQSLSTENCVFIFLLGWMLRDSSVAAIMYNKHEFELESALGLNCALAVT